MNTFIETTKKTLYQCWWNSGLQLGSVPLGPIWDTVSSQTEELESLITSYEKAITYENQVTIAIKRDIGQIVRIATEIEQTAGHHWYNTFMGYVPSATGILHLMLHPMLIVLLCCILLGLLLVCLYSCVYHFSYPVESMYHQLLPNNKL